MENEHKNEPKALGEILEDPGSLIGDTGDPVRAHEAAEVFAGYEVDVISAEREELIASLENPANDSTEARRRLDELNRMLLSARADRTDIVQHPPDTEQGK